MPMTAAKAPAFLANAARALGSAAGIAGQMLRKPVAPPLPGIREVVLRQAAQALGDVARAYIARPDKLVAAQLDLADAHARLARSAWSRMRGEDAAPVTLPAPGALPAPGDRRFSHPDWQHNLLLDVLKQSYLVSSQWAEDVVADADGLDPHTRHKARFYANRIAEALSPTNIPLTNPQVMRSAFATGGASLADGLEKLAADIAAADGELVVPQTDETTFEVGRNLAVTPGKVVFQNELMQLIQYAPATDTVAARPLLVVPPWINKFYVLDLTPEKSFVAWAVAQGLTVFVVSWVNPDSRHAGFGFADYMRNGILAALDAIELATGSREANALGYCIGGTLLAASLAYMAAIGDERIRSATLLAAQVDFAEAGELLVFIDEAQISGLERHMAAKGYLEGRRMAQTFSYLRANALIWSPVIESYMMGKPPPPFDLLYWNSDSTHMPAAMLSFYLRECYLNNALAAGRMVLDGVAIDLKRITIPVYNLAPRDDHIAPFRSVFKVGRHLGGDTRLVVAGSGHVAGIVNPPAAARYGYWTNDAEAETPDAVSPDAKTPEDWLAAATWHSGSWWPDWNEWIARHAGRPVPPRKPGDGRLPPLEDAPGRYVRQRAE
jgi:polyhydroxyalkanoate synthase subunit PhaC